MRRRFNGEIQNFGSDLYIIRSVLGIKQEDFARILGYTRKTLSFIERQNIYPAREIFLAIICSLDRLNKQLEDDTVEKKTISSILQPYLSIIDQEIAIPLKECKKRQKAEGTSKKLLGMERMMRIAQVIESKADTHKMDV